MGTYFSQLARQFLLHSSPLEAQMSWCQPLSTVIEDTKDACLTGFPGHLPRLSQVRCQGMDRKRSSHTANWHSYGMLAVAGSSARCTMIPLSTPQGLQGNH